MQFFIFQVCSFFSRSGSQKPKNVPEFPLIRLRSKVTEHFQNCEKTMRSERTEMAFKERIFIVIEFPETFLLIIYVSRIWPNLTEIGQIVVEL